ncbi:interleukin-1 receptor type 2 [Lepisosteus oculatus]|uniref:Interleukin 1 receptor type 2 n=1 Tax=Lepisosteus oculatus TaxID=7918 RepID=W5MXI9_LEPOC|nr:PREDICTED: interleukin-1 receptor type 2 [Lepisosteus oculatus]
MLLWDKPHLVSPALLIVSLVSRASAFRLPQMPTKECVQFPPEDTLYALQGEAVVLKCHSLARYLGRSAEPGFTFQWVNNSAGQVISAQGGRVHTQGELLWFLPAVVRDSGNYSCILRNASYCLVSPFSLRVYESKHDNLNDLSFTNTADSGSNGRVFCPRLTEYMKSAKTEELKWYKESTPIPASQNKTRYKKTGTSLLIRDVKSGDEGYYTCELNFPFNNTHYKVSRVIKLQITAQPVKPRITNPLNNTVETSLGSTLLVPCKVFMGFQTTQQPYIMWLANNSYVFMDFPDKRVTEGPEYVLTEPEGNFAGLDLIISQVRQEDVSTEFKCIARNGLGSHESTVKIKLIDEIPAPRIIYPVNVIFVSRLGSSLIIPCRVNTGHQLENATEVTWLMNGREIEDSFMSGRVTQEDKRVYSKNGTIYSEIILIFSEVREEDTRAEIKCVAQNSKGYHEVIVQVNLEDSKLTWLIVGLTGTATFLSVVCIFLYHLFKPRSKKDYFLAKS